MSEINNENSSLKWKRPQGPLRVWRIVEGRAKTKDSLPLQFSIQDIPKDRYDEVLDHFCKYYIPDEPICNSLHVKDNPLAIEDFRNEWRDVLEQGVSVGAFCVDPNLKKPFLIGVNVLYIGSKEDDDDFLHNMSFKSDIAEKMIHMFWKVQTEANVFEKCGSDTYLGAIGLCVHPRFRGYGLAKHLLDARIAIGRELGVPVTVTNFTGPSSQSAAQKAGFEILLEKRYDEILDESGKVMFPVKLSKTIKVMCKQLY